MNPTSAASRLGVVAVAISTAIVLVALAITPFLNPVWVGFEQGRTGAAALTGYDESDLRAVTNAILADLVIGPPDFDVALDGRAVLTQPERAHMRDVRGAFAGFFAAAAVALVVLGAAIWLSRRGSERAWTRREVWRGVRIGAAFLGIATLIAGVIAVVAFDLAFEVFHRLFFASGTYLFDPATSKLVQLFPDAFWSETAIAVGAVIVVLAVATTWLAGRRLRAVHAAAASPDGGGTEGALSQTAVPAERGTAR